MFCCWPLRFIRFIFIIRVWYWTYIYTIIICASFYRKQLLLCRHNIYKIYRYIVYCTEHFFFCTNSNVSYFHIYIFNDNTGRYVYNFILQTYILKHTTCPPKDGRFWNINKSKNVNTLKLIGIAGICLILFIHTFYYNIRYVIENSIYHLHVI